MLYSRKPNYDFSIAIEESVKLGRNLKMFTVHSLRHAHVMNYVVDRSVPLPIVQKQVGHRSLKTTSVYLSPSTEKLAEA